MRLEGRVTGRRLEALRRACVKALAGDGDLSLDLREVSYIDPAGGAFLRRLTDGARVMVTGSSKYVNEVLRVR